MKEQYPATPLQDKEYICSYVTVDLDQNNDQTLWSILRKLYTQVLGANTLINEFICVKPNHLNRFKMAAT